MTPSAQAAKIAVKPINSTWPAATGSSRMTASKVVQGLGAVHERWMLTLRLDEKREILISFCKEGKDILKIDA